MLTKKLIELVEKQGYIVTLDLRYLRIWKSGGHLHPIVKISEINQYELFMGIEEQKMTKELFGLAIDYSKTPINFRSDDRYILESRLIQGNYLIAKDNESLGFIDDKGMASEFTIEKWCELLETSDDEITHQFLKREI